MALPAQFVNAAAITPHDTNDNKFDAIYNGSAAAGNIAVKMVGGQEVTFNNVQPGATLYIKVVLVKATGTTATNLVGLR